MEDQAIQSRNEWRLIRVMMVAVCASFDAQLGLLALGINYRAERRNVGRGGTCVSLMHKQEAE